MSDAARPLEDCSSALLLDDAAPPAAVPARRRRSWNIPGDLVLYAALVGHEPQIDPSLADPLVVAANARRERPWSPVVLSLYLRQVYRAKGLDGLVDLAPPGLKLGRPALAGWVRRRRLTSTATARRAA